MNRAAAILLFAAMFSSAIGCFKKSSVPPPTQQRIVLHGIVDFSKASIRPDSLQLLEEAAAMLKANENAEVVAAGHSDSIGDAEYNRTLSLRRAEKVRDYLVKLGVSRERIVVVGKGASEPIASNATPAGRAANRRVDLTVYDQ